MSDVSNTPDQADVTMSSGAVYDGAYTLLIADFSDTGTAQDAYEALKEIEDGRHVQIEGVIVVNRSADGKLEIQKATDHATGRGLKWGVVGGAVLGLIFPPTILGSAAVLGAAGAAAGKVAQLHHRSELSRELESAVQPGHSAIVALVSDPAVVELRRALAMADAIVESAVDHVVAQDVKAAAKEAEEGEAAGGANADDSEDQGEPKRTDT